MLMHHGRTPDFVRQSPYCTLYSTRHDHSRVYGRSTLPWYRDLLLQSGHVISSHFNKLREAVAKHTIQGIETRNRAQDLGEQNGELGREMIARLGAHTPKLKLHPANTRTCHSRGARTFQDYFSSCAAGLRNTQTRYHCGIVEVADYLLCEARDHNSIQQTLPTAQAEAAGIRRCTCLSYSASQ